jgi:hypothetical protein
MHDAPSPYYIIEMLIITWLHEIIKRLPYEICNRNRRKTNDILINLQYLAFLSGGFCYNSDSNLNPRLKSFPALAELFQGP